MKRHLNPAFTQSGQGMFKVLKLLPTSCVWWCWYIQCAQRTHTRPKALSTGDMQYSAQHLDPYKTYAETTCDTSTILNMHRMFPSMFIRSV